MQPLRATGERDRAEIVYVWQCPLCSNEFSASRRIIRNRSKNGEPAHCGCDTQRRQSEVKLGSVPANRQDDTVRSSRLVMQGILRYTELTQEQVVDLITADCHYCGSVPSLHRPLGQGRWRKLSDTPTNGIDRKDSAQDYFMSNVVSCCQTCNYFKRDMPYKEFIELCRKIARKHQ